MGVTTNNNTDVCSRVKHLGFWSLVDLLKSLFIFKCIGSVGFFFFMWFYGRGARCSSESLLGCQPVLTARPFSSVFQDLTETNLPLKANDKCCSFRRAINTLHHTPWAAPSRGALHKVPIILLIQLKALISTIRLQSHGLR